MWVAHCIVKQKEGKQNKKEIDDTVCGLHTASSNKRKENRIKKELTTQHVGCTPHHHHPSGHLFPFYPCSPSTHSHTPSTLLSRCRCFHGGWRGRQHWCCCREVVGGWCLGLLRLTRLPWVGLHMGIDQGAWQWQWMVVQWWWWCEERGWRWCAGGLMSEFEMTSHIFNVWVSDWLWEFWDVLSKKEPVHSFLNRISWKKMENLQKLYYITIG